jgi:hypothetical protein
MQQHPTLLFDLEDINDLFTHSKRMGNSSLMYLSTCLSSTRQLSVRQLGEAAIRVGSWEFFGSVSHLLMPNHDHVSMGWRVICGMMMT